MFRIIRNLWIDTLRRRRKEGVVVDIADHRDLAGSSGAQEVDALLMLHQVRSALAKLPPEQREVLVLVCIECRTPSGDRPGNHPIGPRSPREPDTVATERSVIRRRTAMITLARCDASGEWRISPHYPHSVRLTGVRDVQLRALGRTPPPTAEPRPGHRRAVLRSLGTGLGELV
jgi:hypothetical protein